MAQSPQETRENCVYRVISPSNWDRPKGRPKPTAFKQSKGRALSVFSAERQTPRGVLQYQIDTWQERLKSDDPSEREVAAHNLSDFGDTVEKLLENGFHVAKLPLVEFTDRNFEVTIPEPNGHQDALGDFEAHKRTLAILAEILSTEECLDNG